METNHAQAKQMPTSMREVGVLYRKYCYSAGGTFGTTGFSINFNSFGGTINSAGGSNFSNFGNNLVSGFAQPTRLNDSKITRRYFISPPSFSMEDQEV
jgi:hypothetical protein